MNRWIKPFSMLSLVMLLALPAKAAVSSEVSGAGTHTSTAMVRLPGHVLPALSKATLITPAGQAAKSNEPLTLTLTLRRDHQAVFERYLHEIYDSHSKSFHHYLTQRQIADRFGPSRDDYDSVLAYLQANGFHLVEGSKNRLTITVRGTRAQTERAFAIHIGDYHIGKQKFFANKENPALPRSLAGHVQAIAGLSDLSRPHSVLWALRALLCKVIAVQCGASSNPAAEQKVWDACLDATNKGNAYNDDGIFNPCAFPPPPQNSSTRGLSQAAATERSRVGAQATAQPLPWSGIDGTGQTIGLVEFDSFAASDVQNYLAFVNQPAALINNLSEVNVNGGATIGPGEEEVLLDIDTTLTMASGAKTVVYDAPFNGAGSSFQAVFNQMINDKVTIISNSWAYCEDQSSPADAQSIDTILQNAAAAGITVFNGAGDTGSTCLDGSANTVAVPADSPNATAVGGSSEPEAPSLTYAPETWWNGSNSNPQTGQGGFGISKFFAAKNYQTVLTGSSMRMVPDVVVNSDPAQGIYICQADAGGCPTGLEYGGTSIGAPEWAAMAARLNQAQGANLGFLNPELYPLANTSGFHNAAALGSDLAHVGLGSPNLNQLYLLLTGQSAGTPSASLSQTGVSISTPASGVIPDGVPADGATAASVVVALRDANGNAVSGKTVTLSAGGGSSAVISPSSAVTTLDNGAAIFTVTDLTPENLTLTATDTSDGVQLQQTPKFAFVTPTAAGASLNASPAMVTADGVTPAFITVTLKDSLGRPSPGKLIQINQSGGTSVLTGPNPPVTDSTGMIQFTAVDSDNATITYSAVDVTDGNLPFPGTGTVTFSNAPEARCSNTFAAAPGFVAQPYATGFIARNFCVGIVCGSGCPGAFGIAFDSSGNLFVSDEPTGDIYKFPPGGGVANSNTLLTQTAIPTLIELAFDSNGNLYGGVNETGGDYTNGAVLQIDPSTGNISRTVASGLTCPGLIAVDPLSEDVFAADNCFGDGLNSSSLWRVSNPSGGSPATSVYATLPNNPNGTESFAPSGTLYVLTNTQIAQVSGTNQPQPATVSVVPNLSTFGLGLLAQGAQAGGAAQFLIMSFNADGNVPGGIGTFDLTSSPPSMSSTLVTDNGQAADMTVGPDGCVYAARGVAVFKITDTTGACNYAAANPGPSLSLTPFAVSPNPAQGSSQTLAAAFHFVTVPAGTPVNFLVSGANPQSQQGLTNADGQASFSYTGAHQGVDTIIASATVSSTAVTSNQAVITWGPGSDVTFLTLNQSPTSATPGQQVNLAASITDVSTKPAVPIEGQQVTFTLGGSSCTGTSNATGIASCQITAGGAGITTLSASFPGTGQYVASNASIGFNVISPSVVTPTPTPSATPTITPTPTPTATPTPSGASIEVIPADIVFPPRAGNRGTATRKFRITNVGTSELTGYVTPLQDTAFFVRKGGGNFSLAPGKSRVVVVRFKPPQVGNFSSNVLIVSNDPVHRQLTVTLSGIGTPRPKIRPGG